MAVMIIAMLFIGVGMVSSVSTRPWLIDLHRPMGIAILLLAVLRLRNRMRHQPPALPASLPVWQRRAARVRGPARAADPACADFIRAARARFRSSARAAGPD